MPPNIVRTVSCPDCSSQRPPRLIDEERAYTRGALKETTTATIGTTAVKKRQQPRPQRHRHRRRHREGHRPPTRRQCRDPASTTVTAAASTLGNLHHLVMSAFNFHDYRWWDALFSHHRTDTQRPPSPSPVQGRSPAAHKTVVSRPRIDNGNSGGKHTDYTKTTDDDSDTVPTSADDNRHRAP